MTVSTSQACWDSWISHLEEADGGRLLTEALTAEVEAVLADDTSLVSADTAIVESTFR